MQSCRVIHITNFILFFRIKFKVFSASSLKSENFFHVWRIRILSAQSTNIRITIYFSDPTLHRDQVAFVVAVPRVRRSPKPLVGLLHTALKSHHHHHHFRPHYGGGDYYGPSGGSFSGSGASASAFSGSQNGGHGGGGSNSHASAASNSLSFNTPFGGISASSSFAQSNSNSYGGNSWYVTVWLEFHKLI